MFSRAICNTATYRLASAAYSTSSKKFAEAAAAGAVEFKINFCTPHSTIYGNKVVEQVRSRDMYITLLLVHGLQTK